MSQQGEAHTEQEQLSLELLPLDLYVPTSEEALFLSDEVHGTGQDLSDVETRALHASKLADATGYSAMHLFDVDAPQFSAVTRRISGEK